MVTTLLSIWLYFLLKISRNVPTDLLKISIVRFKYIIYFNPILLAGICQMPFCKYVQGYKSNILVNDSSSVKLLTNVKVLGKRRACLFMSIMLLHLNLCLINRLKTIEMLCKVYYLSHV